MWYFENQGRAGEGARARGHGREGKGRLLHQAVHTIEARNDEGVRDVGVFPYREFHRRPLALQAAQRLLQPRLALCLLHHLKDPATRNTGEPAR